MVTKAELYLLTLRELEKSTGNILMSAVVTRDGLIMSCTSSDDLQKEAFAAYGAVAFKSANDTMQELTKENTDLMIFESAKYRVLTILVVDVLLMALTEKDIQMGIMLLEMQKTARKIKELFD